MIIQTSSDTTSSIDKTTLKDIVSKYQSRTISEELDFLQELGGQNSLFKNLEIDTRTGLLPNQLEERKQKFGINSLPERPRKGLCTLIKDALDDFTLRALLVAAAVSIIANMIVEEDHRHLAWIEGFAVFIAVAVCASVTAINDYKNEKQFFELQKFANSKKLVTVLRERELQIHPTELLVTDIVKITEGMEIPADILLFESHDIICDESAMTGESDLLHKDTLKHCQDKLLASSNVNDGEHIPSPILLSGTKVQSGAGWGIVIVVGKDSCLGKIQDFLQTEPTATPLQQKLETVAKTLGKFGLYSAIITLVILIIRMLIDMGMDEAWGEGARWLGLIDYFIVAITVIVVAIPEGLPLSVTLCLAYSVKRMLKDKNLVRKIQATEAMGSVTTICSDKTGTLTQNKMTVVSIWNGKELLIEDRRPPLSELLQNDEYQNLLVEGIVMNSLANLDAKEGGSSSEIALLEFLMGHGVEIELEKKKNDQKEVKIFPFNSSRKRMSAIISSSSTAIMHLKGAAEIVLSACDSYYDLASGKIQPITEDVRAKFERVIQENNEKALRTLSLAYKTVSMDNIDLSKDENGVLELEKSSFTLLSIIGIRDVLREGVTEAVTRCKIAGIKVIMVTGDNKVTATAIAKDCGILEPNDLNNEFSIMEGSDFVKKFGKPELCNKEELLKVKSQLRVLARSRPEDKHALVSRLMENGEIVAVTGDGTNDAPALKKADVGFAMNSGTAVAKEAADIISIDDNFASIVEAAKWGRNIYENIQKFLMFLLSVNLVAVTSTLVAAAVLRESIIKAVNMLWVNLIINTLASLALATEPPNKEILKRKPIPKDDPIITNIMMKHILGQAMLQFTILMIFAFTADQWFPEYKDHQIDPETGLDPYYSDNGMTVRSGRGYMYQGTEKDYLMFQETYGPSVHFTLIFNVFVCLQIFNFFCARFLRDEKNIFSGIFDNKMFLGVIVLILGLQIIFVEFGGKALNCAEGGLDIRQWLICIGFGSITWVWNFLLKFMKFNRCPKFGARLTNPLKDDDSAIKLKRGSKKTLIRHYSNLTEPVRVDIKRKVREGETLEMER